jgi:hypothetical protein
MPKKSLTDELNNVKFKDLIQICRKIKIPITELETYNILKESATYKILKNYFSEANYDLKTKGNKTTFSINHKQYYQIKMDEKIKIPLFKNLKLNKRHNNLEAKIVMNIPFIYDEFIIHAKKNENNTYYCNSVSYKHFFLYQKEKSTSN